MKSVASIRSMEEDPVSQFEILSKRVRKFPSKAESAKALETSVISPREEIYKSMLREIRNGDVTQMNSLVHKASGILRLAHYNEVNKGRKVTVSWDIDGRRVLKYEDISGTEKSMLQRQSNAEQAKSKNSLLDSLHEPIFGLDTHNLKVLSEYILNSSYSMKNSNGILEEGKKMAKNKVSKVWEDYIETGDVSKLWQSKDGVLVAAGSDSTPTLTSPAVGVGSKRLSSGSVSGADVKTVSSENDKRPPWKTSYKPPSSSYTPGSRERHVQSVSSLHSPSSRPKRIAEQISAVLGKNKTKSSVTVVQNTTHEKVDRIQNICVVNGSVVSFKNFGFENFSNWFGDDIILEMNQQRRQPKIHHELDLSNVQNRDIKIRLLEGRKLEVEAMRRIPGTAKLIHVKEVIVLPDGFRAEDLLMCRTKAGKLVVEELTSHPIAAKTVKSRQKISSKYKEKWKSSTKI